MGIKPRALRGAITATHTAARHAAVVVSKNEMPPKKNRAEERGRDKIIIAERTGTVSLLSARALRTKIKVNITAGNTPNDDITQWSCKSCRQTLLFTADTPIFAFVVLSKRMH